MLKNHFIKIIFSVLSSAIIILASCAPPYEGQAQNEPTHEEIRIALEQVSGDISSLSQTVATSINAKPEVVSIIYEEVSKRFDGDSEALLSTILEKQLKDGVTVSEYLSGEHSSKAQRADGESDSVPFDFIIEELGILMNTQVYMPEYDKWDHVTIPLVGFAPISGDAEKENSITAYDPYGNKVLVTEANYKEKPIFIIGPNERAFADGSLDPDVVSIPGLASMSSEGASRSMSRDVAPGRDGAIEILEYYELWKNYEPFYKGANELRFQFSNVCYDKKFGWDGIKSHSRQYPNNGLFEWSQVKCGETLHYRIWENDGADDKLAINKSMSSALVREGASPTGTPKPLTETAKEILKFLWKNRAAIIKVLDPVDQIGEGDIYFSDYPKEYTDSKNYVFKMNYNLLQVESTPEPQSTPIAIVTEGPGFEKTPVPICTECTTPVPPTDPPPCTTCTTPPPVVYTLTVVWVEGIGNGNSETRTGITPDSVQYINTSNGWSVDTHSPAGIKYISFAGWEITGDADIDNLNSNSTYVRNFRGDVSVKPTYTMN